MQGFDFGEGGGAALADGGIACVFADVDGIVPAALALFAVGVLDFDLQSGKRFAGGGTVEWSRRDNDL